MKTCKNCQTQVEDSLDLCPNCGSAEFQTEEPEVVTEEVKEQASQTLEGWDDVEPQVPVPEQAPVPAAPDLGNGNIVAGIVGAVLFGLIGAALYFLVYQLGFIAGICGLVIFILANFGYHLFARGNKNTIIGIIVSIIVMLVMIFVAEYFCLSFEIFRAFKEEEGITFFDAARATPNFLAEPEISGAVIKDLLIAYALGIIASISTIINAFKSRKK